MRFSLQLGLFLAAALAAFSAETKVRVNASRALQVCIVDGARATPARLALHREIGRALSSALTSQAGETIELRVEAVDSRIAVARMEAGTTDAIFVFGTTRPRALQRLDSPTLAGHLGVDRQSEAVWLIVTNGDATVERMLLAGFPAALNLLAPARDAVVAAK